MALSQLSDVLVEIIPLLVNDKITGHKGTGHKGTGHKGTNKK